MNNSELITIDPEILAGVAVFKDTRVPTGTIFEYIENDYSLKEFFEGFFSECRVGAASFGMRKTYPDH